jgi:uncharacterized protein (TIGR02466 family)
MAIYELFATPVYASDVDNLSEINDELEECLKSVDFSYIEGWGNTHQISDSTFDKNILYDFDLAVINKEIHKHIRKYFNQIDYPFDVNYHIRQSWLVKYSQGDYAHIHNHGLADISGVYYHKISKGHERLFFECPTPTLTTSTLCNHLSHSCAFDVCDGKIILFPAFLYHGVHRNSIPKDRIALSFNVYMQK